LLLFAEKKPILKRRDNLILVEIVENHVRLWHFSLGSRRKFRDANWGRVSAVGTKERKKRKSTATWG